MCFQNASPTEKKIFRENYGNKSAEAVQEIINLYREQGLPELYHENERQLQNQILKRIEAIPNEIIPHEVFSGLLINLKQRLITF